MMPVFNARIIRVAREESGIERSGRDWQDIAVGKQV